MHQHRSKINISKGESHVKKTKNITVRTTKRRLDEFQMAANDGLDVHDSV